MVKQLEYLTMENFKCFKAFRMYISNLAILCGFNSSGKSTVYQPLLLLSQALRTKSLPADQKINSLKWPLKGDLVNLGTAHDLYCNFFNASHLNFGFEFVNDDNCYTFKLDAEREKSSLNTSDAKCPKNINWKKLFDSITKLTYISADRSGPKEIFPISESTQYAQERVGYDGKYSCHWYHESATTKISKSHLCSESIDDSFSRQVNAWLNFVLSGAEVKVVPKLEGSDYLLKFRTSESGEWMKPMDVGHGFSYVFPIIVALILSKPDDLIIIDSPEAHLHPSAQSNIGKMIAKIATSGVQIIVETHSDHVLNGIRISVKDEILAPEKLNMLFFTKPTPKNHGVISPSIDKNGKIDYWPDGFFDQNERDICQLIGFD